MEIFLKWLLIAVIVGCVLKVIVITIKKFKLEIEARLTKETGHLFFIKGKISLSIHPLKNLVKNLVKNWKRELSFSFIFHDLYLESNEDFKKDMMTVEKCEIRFKLHDLLHRRIKVDNLILYTPCVFLEKRKDGKKNWTKRKSDDCQLNEAIKQQDNYLANNKTKSAIEFIPIDKFSIVNGSIFYCNRVENRKKEASRLNITLFNLNIDRLMAIRFFENFSDQSQTTPQPTQLKTDNILFKTMVIEGDVKINNLNIANICFENLKARMTGNNGILIFDNLTSDFYQGSLFSKISFDIRKEEPQLDIEIDAKNIDAKPFLYDTITKCIIIGNLKASIFLTMTGKNVDTIKKTMTGKGELNFENGIIVGINFVDMIINATSYVGLIKKKDAKFITKFNELSFLFSLQNKIIDISNATLVSPHLKLIASGDVNLIKNRLDFKIEPMFVANLTGLVNRNNSMIPLLMTGPIISPSIIPDIPTLVTHRISDIEQVHKKINGEVIPAIGNRIIEDSGKLIENSSKLIENSGKLIENSSKLIINGGKLIEDSSKMIEGKVKDVLKTILPVF